LRDYEKNLVKKKAIQKILTAKFEEYTGFRNLRTSHTDFLHRQLTSPFLLTTPCGFGEPPEFPVAGIEHIASWSKADSRGDSSPRQKEKREVERSSSSFCTVVVQQRRRSWPLGGVPDLSGVVLLSTELLLLPASSKILPPTFSVLRASPLFRLVARVVLSAPALEAGPLPQHVFWLSWSRSTRHRSQKD